MNDERALLIDTRPIVGLDVLTPCHQVPITTDHTCPVCREEVMGVVSWIVLLGHECRIGDAVTGIPAHLVTWDGRN